MFEVRRGKRVQRIAAVAREVALFRRRADQAVEPAVTDDRAEGMHARTAVGAQRREIAERHPELIEERPPARGQLGCRSLERGPARGAHHSRSGAKAPACSTGATALASSS